jgi:UDP:flavonoid glycosyltransferase YjiC (YdhE family)
MDKTSKKIKIGIDIHGVIDAHPEFFSTLTKLLVDNGHEVHIITGSKITEEMEHLEKFGISYTHLFSITDHHANKGTAIKWDEKGEPHLDPYLWDKTKAEYCKEAGIDLHFDDSDTYNYFFKTPYARFFAKDTHRNKKRFL